MTWEGNFVPLRMTTKGNPSHLLTQDNHKEKFRQLDPLSRMGALWVLWRLWNLWNNKILFKLLV